MDHNKMNSRQKALTTAQSIMTMIESNIETGKWVPGTRLPTERELETSYGISRNTLRKSLKRLEAAGKITREVGRGAFVSSSPLPASSAPSLVEGALLLELPASLIGSSPAEVMEVRLMLEPRAAELAASRASQSELQYLSTCLESAVDARDVADFEHWDAMLHRSIIEAARNDLLTHLYGMINSIRNQPEWAKLKERTVTAERRRGYQEQHLRIVSAIRERNAREAYETMRGHLLEVRSNLLGTI